MAKHFITPAEKAEVARIFARQRKEELTRFIHFAIKDGRINFDTSKAKIEMLFREHLDDKEQRRLDTIAMRKRNAEMAGVALSESESRLAEEVERQLTGEASSPLSEVALSEVERLMAEDSDPRLRYRDARGRPNDPKAESEAERLLMEHGAAASRTEI